MKEEESANRPFRLGEWIIHPEIDEIDRAGERCKLEPRAMAVLVLLAERAPAVVSSDEIERIVWRDVVVTPHSVYQAIAQLRKLLGDDPKSARYIATVPRKGYRLVASVSRLDLTPPSAPLEPAKPNPVAEHEREGSGPGNVRRIRPFAWAAGLALIVVLAAMIVLHFQSDRRVATEAPPSSIAVLRFEDLSPAQDSNVFAEGMAAELVNALSQHARLRVAARTSSFLMSDSKQSAQQIGQTLGVRYLVEGTMQRDGERIRVNARLIDTADGYQRWSQTYDRPFANLLSLQDDLARSIAGSLHVFLASTPGVGLSVRKPKSLTAYELYLLGQQRYFERTPAALAESAGYFQRAIDADPEFAAAYAGLADTYLAEYYFASRPYAELVSLAAPLLARARTLDPQLVSAVALDGVLKLENGDLAGAEASLTNAIAINPNYPRAHLWLAMTQHEMLRFEPALTSLNRAVELDPLMFVLYTWRALIFDSLGRSALGRQDVERALMIAPKHPNASFNAGLNALSRGQIHEAVRHYTRATQLAPERTDLLQGLALLELEAGATDAARTHLELAATKAPGGVLYFKHSIWLATIANDAARIASLARELAALEPDDAYGTVDAAFFLALAGESNDSVSLYERALARPNGRRAMYANWTLRWGMEYHPLAYATALRAAGDSDRADRALLDVEQHLDRAERNGFRHWGTYYIRAGIAAQRGENPIALQRLEQAAALGWRRTWWVQRDPSFAPLRTDARFIELIQSLQKE